MRALLIALALLLLVPATAAADLVDRRPRLGPRRRPLAVGRVRVRAARGPRPPLHPRPLLHRQQPTAPRRPCACACASSARGRRSSAARPPRGPPTGAGSGCATTARIASRPSRRTASAWSTRRTGRTRARLLAPVNVSGGSSTTVHGATENTTRGGPYRGRMVLIRDGGAVLVVNHVSLEHYLYGVVPAEMPADWAPEALKAQAVVARSYALTSRRPGEPYDVFADVRSQVYNGLLAEVATTNAAVRATRARVVTVGGQVAQTFFFSTSGGRTASNEEGFGGTPLSYLRSVEDPHDDLSPVPHLDRPVHAPRGGAQARLAAGRRPRGPARRVAHAVGPRGDRRGAGQRGQPRGERGGDPHRARAAQHLDHRRQRAVAGRRARLSWGRPRAPARPRRRRRPSTGRRAPAAARPPRAARAAPARPSPARSRPRTRPA